MTQQDDPSRRHKAYSVHWYTPADLVGRMVRALTVLEAARLGWSDPLAHMAWGDPCTCPTALAYQKAQGLVPPAWHLTEGALEAEWADLPLFVNPPFGRGMGRWVERCAAHTRPVILLTPASTEVEWWQDAYGVARGVLFMRRRIEFLDQNLVPRKENPKGTTLFLFAPTRTPLAGAMTAAFLAAFARDGGHIWQDLGDVR
jgi:hypothetical protein